MNEHVISININQYLDEIKTNYLNVLSRHKNSLARLMGVYVINSGLNPDLLTFEDVQMWQAYTNIITDVNSNLGVGYQDPNTLSSFISDYERDYIASLSELDLHTYVSMAEVIDGVMNPRYVDRERVNHVNVYISRDLRLLVRVVNFKDIKLWGNYA